MMGSQANPEGKRILRAVAARRGFLEADLRATVEDLPDEALLANIGLVSERIRKALYSNEPLVIFGHDDPDGITSTYILYQFLNSCGYQRHNYFIPNRNLEPHGIQQGFIDYVRDGGYTLVIAVDNGISSYQGVEALSRLGCDTVIVDHHLIQPEQLPKAYGIVNPQLPDCQYPFKALAGVGVVLMLTRYLGRLLEHPVPESAFFWTAVGSIADKVPMIGLNRVIVRHVFERWNDIRDQSVDFLLRNFNRIDSYTDIFNFMQSASRLIANGREERGQHTAMRFLLQMGDAKAELFEDMEAQKKQWESELNKVFRFLDTITVDYEGNGFIYFDDEGVIPYSLLGTAATYILNKLGTPTIILAPHNGHIVCEGRCSDGFNMVEAFRHCRDLLIQYGGHVKAAGFSLEPENYDAFLECYNEYLKSELDQDHAKREIEVDAKADLADLSVEAWRELELLLPFGQQNPEPVILIRNVSADDLQKRFNIENCGSNLRTGGQGEAIVSWKGLQTVRLLEFRKRNDHKSR